MKHIRFFLFSALLFGFAGTLVFFPAVSRSAVQEGLTLSFEVVLPSLFPFFVLSQLLVGSGALLPLSHSFSPYMQRLFGVGGGGSSALLLGLAGGYPLGAKTVADLYTCGELSKEEAEQLLCFCSNSGPGFFLGLCSLQFGSVRAGMYLYLIHAFAALLCGILLRRTLPCPSRRFSPLPQREISFAELFPSAVQNAFSAVWNVCGFVILFVVLLRILSLLPAVSALSAAKRAALFGFIEMTNGVTALPQNRAGFVLCAALTGWGGLSVHAQTLSIVRAAGLGTKRYFSGKFLHALLSVPPALFVSGWLL